MRSGRPIIPNFKGFGTPDASHPFVALLANGAVIAREAHRGLTS